ncbi:MAG: electron transfer flavoprotein subunit beta/FixA family protein [Planctomycetes bacterium]|nr:electron transfer flavoprotein subunit beta/FixA family protein [Planctomycetota bacterium]
MDIIACIKRVAATDSKIKIGADGKSIDPAGVEFVLNPYDEYAVEQALRTKEAAGKGSVTVVALGGADVQKELRTCLAMGADKAVLIKDGGVAHDAYSTAEILAAWIKTVPHDLVFCGRQAVDGDNSQTGARLATLLGMSCVTDVEKLALDGNTFTAERAIEGGREVVKGTLPAVLTTDKGLNEPRYPNLKGIMAAKKKPLEELAAAAVAPASKVASLALPPERPPVKMLGEGAAAVGALIAALRNEAKVL